MLFVYFWVLGQIDGYYDSIMACSNERSHNNKRTLFNIISVTLTNINMRRFSNIYGNVIIHINHPFNLNLMLKVVRPIPM